MQTAAICRLAGEFESAIEQFEREEVDCIITLHLAYSPSLEAIEAFLRDAASDCDPGYHYGCLLRAGCFARSDYV